MICATYYDKNVHLSRQAACGDPSESSMSYQVQMRSCNEGCTWVFILS